MQQAESYQRTVSSGMVFEKKFPAGKQSAKDFQQKRILLCLIEEEMELSVRSNGCLNNSGIKLIGQLVQKSASELIELKNFGRTSLHEIENNLSEMGLTLSMNLNFPPWDGSGNGAELIRILSQQEPGGGFQMDDNAAKAMGIDLMKVNQRFQESAKTKDKKTLSIMHAKYLLELLESKFEKDIPYLTDLLKPHRVWLAKQSK
ncbi:MAG: hypothetical protein KBA53_13825 [Thermoclostridium sp.]|nr:hypothetical protein [Thermoclostridium sp.]